jgi:hypothetical protein
MLCRRAASSCIAASVLAALACIAIASAQTPSPATSEQSECTEANAEAATVRAIASDLPSYVGRCVTVSGVVRRFILYANVDGLYRRRRDWSDPSSNGAALGLDGVHRFNEEHWDEYRAASITGRVGDCTAAHDAADALSENSKAIVMVSGYCHTAYGAVLRVADAHIGEARPFERRMGAWAGPDYGDLEPATPDSAHGRFAAALAQSFLAALRARDESTLLAWHDPSFHGSSRSEEQRRLIDFLLYKPDSPFAVLRSRAHRPQTIVLVPRGEPKPEEAAVCFCRRADCDARWPIAWFDADNLPDRPYACTHVTWSGDPDYDPPAAFHTPMEQYGLAEP